MKHEAGKISSYTKAQTKYDYETSSYPQIVNIRVTSNEELPQELVHVQGALWFWRQVVHGGSHVVDGGKCCSNKRAPQIEDGYTIRHIRL